MKTEPPAKTNTTTACLSNLLTTEEVAEQLKVAPKTIRALLHVYVKFFDLVAYLPCRDA